MQMVPDGEPPLPAFVHVDSWLWQLHHRLGLLAGPSPVVSALTRLV